MSTDVELIYRRNLLMIKLAWVFLLVDIIMNAFLYSPLLVYIAPAGILLVGMTTYLVIRKRLVEQMMFVITGLLYAFLFFLIVLQPSLISYIFLWFGLILVSVYQSYRVILFAGLINLVLTNYFFFMYYDEIFRSVDVSDSIYFSFISLFITAVFVVTSRFGDNLRKTAESRIKHMAYHDELTGLPNRRLFRERLRNAIDNAEQQNHSTAIIFLDLDRFKVINDSLGHSIGDMLLQKIAVRLTECVGQDATIARLGGDEFIILLPDTTRAKAEQTAVQIMQAVQAPLTVGEYELFMTPSIGISMYPTDGKDVDTLTRNADTAMYHVKEQGKNKYRFFLPSMNDKSLERLQLESDLRKALERQEFVLYYQPRVQLTTQKVVSYEALIRWNHPVRGLISPAQFIPMAEDTGLIVPIGEWVLRTACMQNKRWQEQGFTPSRISVNLSVRQFQHQNLVNKIIGILEQTQLDSKWLELEITESIMMHNVDNFTATIEHLKSLGMTVSIDDFGTGFSSLSYLKRFPVDNLKIDRSFVKDITAAPNGKAIVEAIITLGHSLGMKVIAEGVENEDQLAFLIEQECDEVQGYLYSPPLPSAEVESTYLRAVPDLS